MANDIISICLLPFSCPRSGMALAPWAFGLLADAAGTTTAISTGIGFSIIAALANSPLCWHPSMGKPKPKPPQAQRKLPEEDDELFRKIVDGEVVDAEMAFRLNQHRFLEGKPSIVPRVKTYDEDRDHLENITAGARAGFEFRLDLFDRVLAGLGKDGHGDVENLGKCPLSRHTFASLCVSLPQPS